MLYKHTTMIYFYRLVTCRFMKYRLIYHIILVQRHDAKPNIQIRILVTENSSCWLGKKRKESKRENRQRNAKQPREWQTWVMMT